MFIVWLIASLILMSFIEYAAHRWPMHNKAMSKWPFMWGVFEKHTHFHHGRFYRNFDSERDPVAKYINLDMNPVTNVVGLSVIWLPLILLGLPLAGYTFAGVVLVHALFWNIIHEEMHEPKDRWFSRTGWYNYLRDYHKTHHDFPSKNYNVILVGMDHLFGTYKATEKLDDSC